MKNKIIYSSILFFFLFCTSTFAQQEAGYTHFSFNKLAYNPSFAGLEGAANITGIYRRQWLGFQDAPQTAVLNFHSPLFSEKAGFGLNLTSDKLGLTNNLEVSLAYAYHVKLSDATKLSFGLSSSFLQSSLNWSKAKATDTDDTFIGVDNAKYNKINFGLGVMLTHDRYYVGASMPKMLANSLYSVLNSDTKYERPLYVNAGANFPLNPKIELQVNALGTVMKNAPFDIDVNAIVMFNDVFGLGAAYRLDDSVDFLFRVKPSKQFVISASYDYTLSELNNVSNGSIELLLSYLFSYEKKEVINFRFF